MRCFNNNSSLQRIQGLPSILYILSLCLFTLRMHYIKYKTNNQTLIYLTFNYYYKLNISKHHCKDNSPTAHTPEVREDRNNNKNNNK